MASSDSVFGLSYNPPDWPPQFLPVDEIPSDPAERVLLAVEAGDGDHRRKLRSPGKARGTSSIRPVHVVFPEEFPELAVRGADVENYHFWAYVAPEDVAQAFALALVTAPYAGYEAFTIAAADGLNSRDRRLKLAAERWAPLPAHSPPRDSMPPTLRHPIMDITKARDMLGYAPQSDMAGHAGRRLGRSDWSRRHFAACCNRAPDHALDASGGNPDWKVLEAHDEVRACALGLVYDFDAIEALLNLFPKDA